MWKREKERAGHERCAPGEKGNKPLGNLFIIIVLALLTFLFVVCVACRERGVPVNYVALGDSTGVGVGARTGGGYVARLFTRLNQSRPGSKLTNVCVSGATTVDVLRTQIEPALSARPTLITLGIGINDVGSGMDVETFARNYETIIKQLKTTGAPIVITNIPDISFAPVIPAPEREQHSRRISLFNERINDVASRYGLLVVDAFSATHEMIPAHPEFFSEDGFHPSDVGYEFWAESMWPTIKKALGE